MNEWIHSESCIVAAFMNATSLVPYPTRTRFESLKLEEKSLNRCFEIPAQVVTTSDN